MNKNEIVSKLKTGVSIIKYVKTDGSLREAKATLDPVFLPQQTNNGSRSSNDLVVNYFDIEANGWRSFKVNELKEAAWSIEVSRS